jgi:glycine hydroxymethyltransferase
MHVIAAKAVCFKEAMTEEFRRDQFQTVANAKFLAEDLQRQGFRIVSGGTDNHLMLVDLRPFNPDLTGADAEKLLQRAQIIVNKNAIPFDERPPMKASGIRIGTPACTTRGMREDEMKQIARWIAQVLKDPTDETVERVKNEVIELCQQFPVYPDLWETMKALKLGATVEAS